MDWDAFFIVHRDLPREGPGLTEDVSWAAQIARVPPDGRVCDAGCGPGADIAPLRAAVPQGRVDGFEQVDHFVAAAKKRYGDDPAITILQASMASLTGPYDLIWSAGAVYFLGVTEALRTWRPALAPDGAVVFSHPCFWTDAPSPGAVAFWGGDPVANEAETRAQIAAAGYGVFDSRRVTSAAWQAYYGPLLARCDALEEAGPTEALAEAIAQSRQEAAAWHAHQDETGYQLYAVRPL